jgi:hypothetical protein
MKSLSRNIAIALFFAFAIASIYGCTVPKEETKRALGCGFMIPLEWVIRNCLQRSLAL